MQHLREILRQKLALARSHREVARSLGISPSTVAGAFADARSLGLDAAAVEALKDAELEARLYPKPAPSSAPRPEPDCAALHLELRRPGVTLALLHIEFLGAHPEGLRYTAFCERYRDWLKRRSPVMRQVHVAGDKLFVDYAGMRPRIVDAVTGEITDVELFVAVLGASNYTYAEATRTQQVPDFIASVVRTLSFLGGVPRAIVPDQLKSAVIKACRYDPGVQRTTAELGRYYDTTILPARPKSPRDKAKVEVGVQIAERWMLACIRNETFTSLGALNARLAGLTSALNARTMRTYKASRRELFVRLDKPALLPLPAEAFEVSSWKKVGLNIDYHVALEDHFCSAPHALRHEDIELWLRATTSTVEIFHGRERVASHLRSYVRGGFTTVSEHMPSTHRARGVEAFAHSRVGRRGRARHARAVRSDLGHETRLPAAASPSGKGGAFFGFSNRVPRTCRRRSACLNRARRPSSRRWHAPCYTHGSMNLSRRLCSALGLAVIVCTTACAAEPAEDSAGGADAISSGQAATEWTGARRMLADFPASKSTAMTALGVTSWDMFGVISADFRGIVIFGVGADGHVRHAVMSGATTGNQPGVALINYNREGKSGASTKDAETLRTLLVDLPQLKVAAQTAIDKRVIEDPKELEKRYGEALARYARADAAYRKADKASVEAANQAVCSASLLAMASGILVAATGAILVVAAAPLAGFAAAASALFGIVTAVSGSALVGFTVGDTAMSYVNKVTCFAPK